MYYDSFYEKHIKPYVKKKNERRKRQKEAYKNRTGRKI